MTLFALVIAFAVVTLDSNFSSASGNVQDEANSLGQVVQGMRAFPAPSRGRVEVAVRAYVDEVRDHEFAAMRDGHDDPRAERALDRLFAAVQSVQPATQAQREFYNSAVAAVGIVLDERHKRLAAARESLPAAFWVLIFLTAAASLATALFLKVEAPGLEVLMVAILALVIGAGILTTLLVEYPFSGSVAVSSEPFTQGALAELPRG